ncbi:MAG: SPW repeat protein [Steroidobacteraceae bacterium]
MAVTQLGGTRHDYGAQARAASGINVLLGIWLIISPWVFGYASADDQAMWNAVSTGGLVLILAATRYAQPHTGSGMSWVNFLLGLWAIASPWVFVYANQGSAMWNNVATGIVIALIAIWSRSATSQEYRRHGPLPRPAV